MCTAKGFSRALSSFALVPSDVSHPLTSNVMVVNPSGDLELYAVHDTPMHTPWSSRGDLLVPLGKSLRVLPGITETEPPPEPWDILVQPTHSVPGSKSHSVDRLSVRRRGVSESGTKTPPPPMFGRGDEDGFPALSAPSRSRTPATPEVANSAKSLAYSPVDAGKGRPRNGSAYRSKLDPSIRGREINAKRTSTRYHKDLSGWKQQTGTSVLHLIKDDISMVMRKRVIKGYGLADVSELFLP